MTTRRLGQALNRSIGQASGLTVAVLFCLLAVGCGEQDEGIVPTSSEPELVETENSSRSSSTLSATTTALGSSSSTTVEESVAASTPEPSEGEVFDEYIAGRVEEYFELRDQSLSSPSEAPEVDYPELADYSAKAQLAAIQDASRLKAQKGEALREPDQPAVGTTADEEHRVSGVVTLDGPLLTVFDCEVNDDVLHVVATGEVKDDRVITILRVVTLEQLQGVWKVTDTTVTQKIEGVAGCYLADASEFPY